MVSSPLTKAPNEAQDAQGLHPGGLRGIASADGKPKATGEVTDGEEHYDDLRRKTPVETVWMF